MDESANTPEHDPDDGVPRRAHPVLPLPQDPGRFVDGALGHEIEDDGPEPHLDPSIEAEVRALLAHAPAPGPMPDAVSERIERALLDAARLRVDPGPLLASGADTGTDGHPGGGAVLTLPSRAERPRPIYLVAAVAAAAAVVAVGASALHLTKRPNGAAVVGDRYSSAAGASTPASPPPTSEGLHIQLSTTAYARGSFAAQARTLLDHPGQPIRGLAAESPGIGPIATPIGLEACLEEIGAVDGTRPAPDHVSADVATFEGRPAVVVVVTRAGASTAWAVERSCTTSAPGLLQGATPVP
ncbi:hypothetical protein GCM10009868_01520 [Terrabacter aerolatus]|uniref:Uncharacterized protein n=1 Tax=Terrabacter aerolatus TaxID=422442 RepID=A0A512D5T8_9MICO|nr:hypothetical protein [Terrabacter aerolatus]GEO31787.1 hypothetical protein TAE01_35970 [Terrabacter aerolatus]